MRKVMGEGEVTTHLSSTVILSGDLMGSDSTGQGQMIRLRNTGISVPHCYGNSRSLCFGVDDATMSDNQP
jgi:hypothetical protein